MHYILTGAHGFIGSYLAHELIHHPHTSIIAVVRKGANLSRLNDIRQYITVLESDGFKEKNLFQSLSSTISVTVFHLAWEGVIGSYRNDLSQHRNLDLLKNLLSQIKSLPVSAIIALGSQAEYGSKDHPIEESEKLKPLTLYGQAKIQTCNYLQDYCLSHGIGCIWLRLFSSYGPMDNPSWLIPYVMTQFLQNKAPLLTEGTQIWDYLYVEDVAKALIASSHLKGNHIFNLGSASEVMIRNLVTRIYELIQPTSALCFGRAPFRSDQIMYLQANMSKFFAMSSWRPTVPLEKGLEKTLNYLRKSRDSS